MCVFVCVCLFLMSRLTLYINASVISGNGWMLQFKHCKWSIDWKSAVLMQSIYYQLGHAHSHTSESHSVFATCQTKTGVGIICPRSCFQTEHAPFCWKHTSHLTLQVLDPQCPTEKLLKADFTKHFNFFAKSRFLLLSNKSTYSDGSLSVNEPSVQKKRLRKLWSDLAENNCKDFWDEKRGMREWVQATEKQKSCNRLNCCQVMDEQMEVGKLERARSRQRSTEGRRKLFTCRHTGRDHNCNFVRRLNTVSTNKRVII